MQLLRAGSNSIRRLGQASVWPVEQDNAIEVEIVDDIREGAVQKLIWSSCYHSREFRRQRHRIGGTERLLYDSLLFSGISLFLFWLSDLCRCTLLKNYPCGANFYFHRLDLADRCDLDYQSNLGPCAFVHNQCHAKQPAQETAGFSQWKLLN